MRCNPFLVDACTRASFLLVIEMWDSKVLINGLAKEFEINEIRLLHNSSLTMLSEFATVKSEDNHRPSGFPSSSSKHGSLDSDPQVLKGHLKSDTRPRMAPS